MNTRIKVAAVGLIAVVSLAGCGLGNKATQQYKDAGRDGNDNSPALTVEMPDGFGNVATKCVGDVRITTLFHNNGSYGSVSTVVDPQCKVNSGG